MDEPMAEQRPSYPVNFPTGQANQVHHSYIWLGSLIGVLSVVVVGVLTNLSTIIDLIRLSGVSPTKALIGIGISFLAIVVLYGIVVAITVLAYKNLSYVFDEKEFSLYSGIITKRRVHVPYARVQSVNHRQSLVQRIAGVCTVEIDTAGGASNKAVKVPYVQLGTGEAIRHDLFVRKAANIAGVGGQVVVMAPGAMPEGYQAPVTAQDISSAAPVAPGQYVVNPPQQGFASGVSTAQSNVLDGAVGTLAEDFRGIYGEAIAGMEPVDFERRLSNQELLLASVSNSGLWATFITLIITIAVVVLPLAIILPELSWAGFATIPLFVLGAVIISAISLVFVILSFGNFAVRRRGSRIEVERGILQRDFSGIDVDRVQTLVIKQSFIRRLLGFCEVSLGRINASSSDDQNTQAKLNASGLIVHPFLKLDQVDSLIDNLLPEYVNRPIATEFKGLPPIALRRGIIRRCIIRNGLFWVTICAIITQFVMNVVLQNFLARTIYNGGSFIQYMNILCVIIYVVFAIQLVLAALGTVWWKRGSGFAFNDRFVAICNDGLHTETVYYPRNKIQDVFVRTNPFQRMAHTATIGALTAAGVGGTYSVLWDVTEDDSATWLDWLKPRTHHSNQFITSL